MKKDRVCIKKTVYILQAQSNSLGQEVKLTFHRIVSISVLLSAIFLNLRFDIVIIAFFIVDFSTNIKIYVRSAGSVAKEVTSIKRFLFGCEFVHL